MGQGSGSRGQTSPSAAALEEAGLASLSRASPPSFGLWCSPLRLCGAASAAGQALIRAALQSWALRVSLLL